jgi:hypothetical protein
MAPLQRAGTRFDQPTPSVTTWWPLPSSQQPDSDSGGMTVRLLSMIVRELVHHEVGELIEEVAGHTHYEERDAAWRMTRAPAAASATSPADLSGET